jgi:hypothetical protein
MSGHKIVVSSYHIPMPMHSIANASQEIIVALYPVAATEDSIVVASDSIVVSDVVVVVAVDAVVVAHESIAIAVQLVEVALEGVKIASDEVVRPAISTRQLQEDERDQENQCFAHGRLIVEYKILSGRNRSYYGSCWILAFFCECWQEQNGQARASRIQQERKI